MKLRRSIIGALAFCQALLVINNVSIISLGTLAGYALADNKALEVYRWSDAALEAPVARVPVDINNIFVAHGLVFAKTKDYQTPSFQLLRWNGAGLDDLGVHPVELKGFALHGASEQAGHKLVAAVDTKFNVSWFAVTPP